MKTLKLLLQASPSSTKSRSSTFTHTLSKQCRSTSTSTTTATSHTSTSTVPMIQVLPPRISPEQRERKPHWNDNRAQGFNNPWESFKDIAAWPLTKFVWQHRGLLANDPDFKDPSKVPTVKANFTHPASENPKLKSTWLGHAAFLLELPSTATGARGLTLLLDPAFSQRCAPVQGWGMKPRYTQPPASVEELPEIDAIILSHNHYDHCDLFTLAEIYKKHADRPPYLFVPLANAHTFKGTVPDDRVIEMDWWEDRVIQVQGKGSAKIVCTPCQHMCARTPFDKAHALWSSWVVEEINESGAKGVNTFFGGDTGYSSTTADHHDLDETTPVCPAFKEIGEKLGPFDLALLPIGAYAPRSLMSSVHTAPIDAVRVFQDIRAVTAVGMHWGTWRMSHDPIAEAPIKLAEARKVMGLTEQQFGVCAIGETRYYSKS